MIKFQCGMKLVGYLFGWSKLTWVLNAGSKPLVCNVSMQTNLNLVWMVQIDLISVRDFEVDLVPVWNEIDLVVV